MGQPLSIVNYYYVMYVHPVMKPTRKFAGLDPEPVQCFALALESVDNVHGRDSLAVRKFRVCDCIADNVLEKRPEGATRLVVHELGQSHHAPAPCQAAKVRIGHAAHVLAHAAGPRWGEARREVADDSRANCTSTAVVVVVSVNVAVDVAVVGAAGGNGVA